MSKLFTLTVPDVLWINLQVTGSPQPYNYATLEEATFYQFSSGQSRDIALQTARFLTGFARLSPFASGNEATAFVAAQAFARMNGHRLNVTDAIGAEWYKALSTDLNETTAAVTDKLSPDGDTDGHGHPSPDAILEQVLAEYPNTVVALAATAKAQ